jgi:hypothetical protein
MISHALLPRARLSAASAKNGRIFSGLQLVKASRSHIPGVYAPTDLPIQELQRSPSIAATRDKDPNLGIECEMAMIR